MNALKTTEVADRDAGGASSVELSKLVSLVVAALGPVVWRVFELEATARGAFDIAALSERIGRDPAGMRMTSDELAEVAADLAQVINAVLVVPGDGEPPTLPPLSAAFYTRCRLVAECVDGDVWRVTTDNNEVHSRLQQEFCDVRTE